MSKLKPETLHHIMIRHRYEKNFPSQEKLIKDHGHIIKGDNHINNVIDIWPDTAIHSLMHHHPDNFEEDHLERIIDDYDHPHLGPKGKRVLNKAKSLIKQKRDDYF